MEFNREKYLKQLIDGMNIPLIKVVTGIRRCGKSYLLFNIFDRYLRSNGVNDDRIIRISLDNIESTPLRDPLTLYTHIKQRLGTGKYYVLLDEIQFVPGFEEVLNSLLHIPDVDVYVTGSNSHLLSSDIITEFRGRSIEIRVRPLSFSEYYGALGGDRQERLYEYMRYGGLPIVALMNDDRTREAYLREVCDKIYLTDLKQRHNIRNSVQFGELLNVIASGIGTLSSVQKLSDTFRSVSRTVISPSTVNRYIEYYVDAFLIDRVRRYDVKGKRYIASPFKYYFSDIGLRNALLDFRQVEPTHIMENIIYNELLFRGYRVDVGVVTINTVNDKGSGLRKNLEVDFVAERGSRRCYVQSAYAIFDEEKNKQETASLRHIGDSFEKYIVTFDGGKPYTDENGFRHLSLPYFLLGGEL